MRTVKYRLGDINPVRGCVAALGFFDGVHLGHRALISYAVSEARKRHTEAAVFTFAYRDGPKGECEMLTSEEERCALFESLGIDVCFVADFPELRTLSPREFVERTVIDGLGACAVAVGYNFKFGYKGAGNSYMLADIMREHGGEVRIFEALMLDGAPISSTRVRLLLESGRTREACAMLGTPYFISGTVEHGRGDGRKFGYPTLNLPIAQSRVKMRRGVYLTRVKMGERFYTGLTNVGECPSFGKREVHAETFLTDFSGDAYGMEIKVYFIDFLRGEMTFASADELGEQIERDRKAAEERKENIKWQELGLN